MTTLSVRLIDVDDRRAKAAIYGLNQTGRRPHELEEAWIVRALVREDGLSQAEAAELLGRHKSWVCRRLALLEKLHQEVRQDLEVGLLTPTAAREIARLPAGNQSEVVDVMRREALNGEELAGVVRLLLESVTAEQKMFVLAKPRQALGHDGAAEPKGWDPRLSSLGNRLSKQLAALLDRLAGIENFLECRRWSSLMASDRLVLGPIFERLSRDARCVADGAGDLAVEMRGGQP
jgi:ParB-like chromosome segregation protein Spo0J